MVRENPDRKVGLFGGLYNLGWIVGLLIPGFVFDRFGVSIAFYLILVVGIVWIGLMLRFAKKYRGEISVKPSLTALKKIPTLIVLKTMDLAMFSAFLFYFTRYAIQILGLSRSVVSLIVAVEVLFFAVSIYLVGRISKPAIRKYWIPLCVLFHTLAATVILIAVSQQILWLYYLTSIFIGIAGGFVDIWIYSKISEGFEKTEKGTIIGTLGWSYDLATIAGAQIPLLFILAGVEGFTSLYVFPLVILITFFIHRKLSLL